MKEIWKDIEGYEGNYQVSNFGRIKGIKKNVIKKLIVNDDGHLRVWLSKESKKKPFLVHRLVAQAFIPNKNNLPVVNHIDGVKNNNFVSNLEWCTRSENDKHAFKLGLRKVTDGGKSKAIAQIDINTNEIINIFSSISEVKRTLGFSISSIADCANGKYSQSNGFKWEFVK